MSKFCGSTDYVSVACGLCHVVCGFDDPSQLSSRLELEVLNMRCGDKIRKLEIGPRGQT
ncbi:uncharacterized protein LACBIDRAFT_315065 [Laccaria bicolor S238N-H82]|uniref:Predicted protein n=1 Tax=Laccaria bicolor (strain S238N-H82 / ATCC MYA-4686) TaxID=486041 RepID=B0DZQ7_LACBS|nr:uncharacterized protein LACBIDRAFT_315065 [Laccaria bicolor S238N-H82]EDQ99873.1 predicted protein [Laccaria bicolor S238N-H82]|eukprot:XP_001889416.1 predicted protein [Laccaria bicolor S238N-H82]